MSAVLVTGATGFLGGALVRRLQGAGADVFATGRDRAKLDTLPLPSGRKFAIDLARMTPSDPAKLLGGVRAIVHCAALSSAWGRDADFAAANVRATENVIALARTLETDHLVQVSSPAVYFRFEDQFGVSEDMTLPRPVNAYARTKAVAEARIRASGLPFTILRPRGIYGPGDTALLPRLLRAARSGPLPRFRAGAAVTDLTHVSDVVAALVSVLEDREGSAGQTFNVSGGEALPISDIVERTCALEGVAVRWRALPVGPALRAVRASEALARLRPGRPEPRVTAYGLGIFAYSQTLDLSHIRNRIGWMPRVPFEEGLARTFSGESGDGP